MDRIRAVICSAVLVHSLQLFRLSYSEKKKKFEIFKTLCKREAHAGYIQDPLQREAHGGYIQDPLQREAHGGYIQDPLQREAHAVFFLHYG